MSLSKDSPHAFTGGDSALKGPVPVFCTEDYAMGMPSAANRSNWRENPETKGSKDAVWRQPERVSGMADPGGSHAMRHGIATSAPPVAARRDRCRRHEEDPLDGCDKSAEQPFEHFLSVWQGPATDAERIDTPNMPIPHSLDAQKEKIAPLCPDLMRRESRSRMGLAGECPMGSAHLRCTARQRQVRAGTMRGTAPMAGGWLAEGSSTQ